MENTIPIHRFKGSRFFTRLNAGRYVISIQASSDHYCEPRWTHPSINDYQQVEVAIFRVRDRKRGGTSWVIPHRDPRLRDFYWSELFPSYNGTQAVGGWIPIGTVKDIIEDLKSRP